MNFKSCLFAFGLVLSPLALASAPASCPTVSAIQQVGVDSAANPFGDYWYAYTDNNNYETAQSWYFSAFFRGNQYDPIDVLIKIATQEMKSMVFISGPMRDSQTNKWVCHYKTPHSIETSAVTRDL